MSAHLERAQLLLAQARPVDAEREAMQALTSFPEDPRALALLALSRLDQGKRDAALEAAQQASGRMPDAAYYHFVYAHVLHRLDREPEAMVAVQEALRLDPEDADTFALLASIELAQRRSTQALAAAERALELHPEHVGAINLRAMALVRLGRKGEAMAAVDFALHRAPEDAFSHANQGWNHLHRNAPRPAQEHFREALRLDPSLEYAREGMLEALRARHPLYRGMLAYFLWIGRQSGGRQWGLIAGVFVGSGVVGGLALTHQPLSWLWWSLLAALGLFVYLTWTARPLFDLVLRFDRFGCHVLTDTQRTAAVWFGATLLLAIGGLGTWALTGRGEVLLAAVLLAALSICVAATFRASGSRRTTLGFATAGLAVLAVAANILVFRGVETGELCLNGFKAGFIGFQFMANRLAQKA